LHLVGDLFELYGKKIYILHVNKITSFSVIILSACAWELLLMHLCTDLN